MAGMTVLLLLLWAGVTVSSPVDLQKRIVGGKTCDNKTRHYHVYVQGFNGTSYFKCGGSLIHKDWVLTAGHCNESEVTAYMSVHPGDLRKNAIKGKNNIAQREIYDISGPKHDLMLLKLSNSSKITPIDLPTKAECANWAQIKEVEVAGYAATTLGGNDTPSTLQCGKIGLTPVQDCDNVKQVLKTCIPTYDYDHIFCVLSKNVAIQQGDSGGGVVHINDGKLYGVIATGPPDKDARVEPSTAMDLCYKDYRDWIKKHTGIPFN